MGFRPKKFSIGMQILIIIPIQQIILRFQITNIKQFCTFGGGCFNAFCLYCSVFSAIAHDILPLHLSAPSLHLSAHAPCVARNNTQYL